VLVEGMSFGYAKPIVEDISFTLKKGDILALSGINGSGKTTILKTLRGILAELKGTLTFNNVAMSAAQRLESGNFLYLPSENVGAWPDLTLKENFFFFLSYRGHQTADSSTLWRNISDQLFLKEIENKSYSTCSTGERRALHIAAQLTRNADHTILLDEPLAHLDDRRCAGLFDFLRSRKMTCVLTMQASHLDRWAGHLNSVLNLEKKT
jgi:ABC-type multidrug transport system ATPase subunit